MSRNRLPTEAPARRRRTRCAGALAALVLAGAAMPALAAVYKWVDPQGHVHYSDLPPPPEGKLLSVDTSAHAHAERGPERSSSAEPAARSPAARTPAGPPAGAVNGPATNPEALAKLKRAVDNDVANAQSDQCKQAQDRYQSYIHSRRLYKEGPNKERIYLSDQELETERLQAKHEVDELCGESR
ncbi:MAG: DUF4124 domain-containing protein [Proteobacteria bacterium]|nr:DUF4124 domain-containing protein [Pseudomonadota bacterium]